MNIEHFKPAIVYAIYIASTPEKVWEALTTAEFSRKYFSGFRGRDRSEGRRRVRHAQCRMVRCTSAAR